MAISQLNFKHQILKNNPITCPTTTFSYPTNIHFKLAPTKFKLTTTTHCHNTTYRYVDYIPGNNWWNLEINNDVSKVENSVTVWYVVRRIWGLVADDNKLVIYLGFGSLTLAAVSDISIPNLLASSIFAAQSGETLVFYKNLKLLVFLCFASGICTGLRSGCFGFANVVLLKCLRVTLYKNLLFQGIGALINLLTLSWPLALSACFICTLLCTIFLLYGRYQKRAAKLIQDSTARANEVSQETLSLVRTVRVSGTEAKEHDRYKQWLDKVAYLSVRESVAYGLWNFSFSILYRLIQVFAIVMGGISILTGQASAEQLTKYVLYCEWLIYAAWRLADNFSSLLQCVGASEKVFQLIDALPSDQVSTKVKAIWEAVDTRMPILEEVNIYIQPNEVTAIVGLSGSGKSTLVHLLLGLYEPTQGQIMIDGHPLKDLDIRWLREKIGYVGQEPHLFRMDIKSNISYGCSRDIKQEDIEWAAKQANAHKFICSLPDGYETIVNDELLSGGQKQRIAIARAIVRNPLILVLDEPTSALDAESEHYIQDLIVRLKNDMKEKRCILFIAHRLSTARAADRIVVMDGGQVTEVGDHEKLLEQNGLYTRLHQFQMDGL